MKKQTTVLGKILNRQSKILSNDDQRIVYRVVTGGEDGMICWWNLVCP